MATSEKDMAEQIEVQLPHSRADLDNKADVGVIVMAGDPITNSIKLAFSRRRRNIAALGVCGLIMLLLTILTPVLHFVLKQKAKHAAAQLAEDASRYAVVKANFPDPCMIEVDGGYYAFATRNRAHPSLNVQVASAAESISDWTLLEGYDALPVLPAWVRGHNDSAVWAPQVSQRSDGVFVMVYAAFHKDHPRKHCLGMATANNVLGPYDPGNSTEPILCHLSLGGIIDPTFLKDPISNQSYLIYKNDGNTIGNGGACGNGDWPNTPTTFQYSALTPPSWTTIASTDDSFIPVTNATAQINFIDSSTIFLNNAKSDGPNIESPQVWYQEYPSIGRNSTLKRAYHMLYNAGCFSDESYRTEHLVCWLDDAENITSFTDCDWQSIKDSSTHLLLRTGMYPQPGGRLPAMLLAPGGPGVTQDGRYMAFHADIVPVWFKHRNEAGQEQNDTEKNKPRTYTRKRALFIAELETDEVEGLRVARLIMPGKS